MGRVGKSPRSRSPISSLLSGRISRRVTGLRECAVSSVVTGLALLASLAIVTLLGQWLRHRLPDHHLSADSRDTVKLAAGLVATMTALILGLLAFAAKGTNDSRRAEVIAMAAKVHMLDHMLADYGPDTAEARARLREAVADYVRYAGSEEVGN